MFEKSSAANGITLVEVVAGISLMGTLLTVIVVGSSQHLRQLKAADQKRTSVRMLDDFLATWSISNFDVDRIPDAARRSGLVVTGQFGSYQHEEPHSSLGHRSFQVDIRRVGPSGFDIGSVARLTVRHIGPSAEPKQTTWAEVVLPYE